MLKPTRLNILVTLPATILLLAVMITAAGASSTKTLVRTEDFIEIKGEQVSPLTNTLVSDLRLYSCKNGKCGPIPVQVDKVDSIGRYVFPQDANSDRDGDRLDLNDEISFMAEDAGDRMPSRLRPAAAAKGVEIEIVDPIDGGRAWAYLFNEPGSSAPKLPDYVGYRIDQNQIIIQGAQYNLGYQEGRINHDLLRMTMPSGELSADVLDRLRVGIEGQLAGDRVVPFNVPESIVKIENIAVIDGPVRVIFDEVVMVNLGELSFQYGTEYFVKYYRCGQKNSVYFESPAALSELFKTVLFYYTLDFTPDVIGSYYIDPNHSAPIPIKDETRKEIPDDADHAWWGIYGPKGAALMAIDIDEANQDYFTCGVRWRQNPNPMAKRGDYPGRLEIGFECHEKGELPVDQRLHYFNYILVPKDPSPEGLRALADIFERPLEISAKEFAK